MSSSPGESNGAQLTLPPDAPYVQAALDFAETLGVGFGFGHQDVQTIRLAVEEMIAFLRQTALAGIDAPPVTVHFEPQADGLRIRILQKGLPIDVQHLPAYSPANASDEAQSEGLSLFLAEKCMDRVVFVNRGREGSEIVMLKRHPERHIKDRLAAAERERPADEATAEKPDFTIRPARDEEAVEISRCAYLTYGYTYEDYVYYPERLVEMNRNGELRSLVAVTTEGIVMGHCALKFAPGRRNRAELGVLFVRPEYRRHGIGAALWSATVRLARDLGLDSIYARSVTGHRASQRMAEQNGFRDCALLLSLFPRNVDLKSMGGVQAGKMSGMLQWLPLRTPRPRILDVPARYRRTVADLYAWAGIPADFDSPAPVSASSAPALRDQRIAVLNVALMEIESAGPDPDETIRWIQVNARRFCRDKIDTLYLYVNIEEAGAARIVEAAMRGGFVFAGVMPDVFPRGDALVLQYLNLPEDPFADMTVWTDTARRLRDAICAEWRAAEEQPPKPPDNEWSDNA